MSRNRRIAVWVSNDLAFDQRVKKTCETLHGLGWTPVLVGREMPNSGPWEGPWESYRLKLAAHAGPKFYLSLQCELLRWLKKHAVRLDAIWCNDLDTLAPAVWYGKLPVVYDSHEYFTQAAGLTGKPLKRSLWLILERWALKSLPCMITVNESIANSYRKTYGLEVMVVRNMPLKQESLEVDGRAAFADYGIPTDIPIALMQGAYMDRDRGVAEAVAALPEMKRVRLVLVGAGIEWEEAKMRVDDPAMEGRLHCIPRIPFDDLRKLTASADVGLSLDKGSHGNYEMSLPNKLFDFMHARLPMVVTARREVAAMVRSHGLGEVIDEATPQSIWDAMDKVLKRPRKEWQVALEKASESFHWGVDEPQIERALEICLKAHLQGSQNV